MSDTDFKPLEKSLIVDWAVGGFCVLMVLLMIAFPGEETIPYHLLFLSLGLAYGLRVWALGAFGAVLLLTTLVTGLVMVVRWQQEYIEAPELAEVPLMPALIVAMVWHARRRAEAQRQVAVMAEERAALLVRQREFLRDACHAIRTPITIARGHLDLADDQAVDGGRNEDLIVVRGQLERMSRLSSRLLAIAELDQGDSLIRVPVDLAELVDEIGHHWTNSATRHWHVEVQRTGAIPIAVDWVEQSIDALIENAVRFTTPDDVIRVSCGVSGEWAFLEVADSGPGIDIEDRERVFDRFWHRPAVDGRKPSQREHPQDAG